MKILQLQKAAARGIWLGALALLMLNLSANAQDSPPTLTPTSETIDNKGMVAERAQANRDTQNLPEAPRAQESPIPARRLSLGDRVDLYIHSITNPDSVAGPAFGAAINQARNEPPEWGQGAEGYGVRFASSYGRMLIGRTIRFGVAAVDHEDPRFYHSDETGFWRRARFATVHYFIVRTDGGSQIPAFSRFAGVYGAAFISNEWYPASRANTSHALLRGTTALSAGLGWNVFREFWPDIKRALRKQQ